MSELKVLAVQVLWRVTWIGGDGLQHTRAYDRDGQATALLARLKAGGLTDVQWQREEIKALALPVSIFGEEKP